MIIVADDLYENNLAITNTGVVAENNDIPNLNTLMLMMDIGKK